MDQPSIRKNYIFRLCYELLNIIVPFITTPYISRVLHADGVGTYSFTHSIVTYFMLLAALGTASYGMREIAQNRDNKEAMSKLFWEIEMMVVLTSLVSLLLWFILIFFSNQYKFFFLALTPFIISIMFDISWFFTGLELMQYVVIRNTICKVLGLCLLFLLVKTSEDLILYILINSSVQLIGSLSMWTNLHKFIMPINLKKLSIKKHLKETIIYFIPTIATSVYTILDKSLIGIITNNPNQNGYYEQATQILLVVKAITFNSVNAVMGARMSYLFASDRIDEIKLRIQRSMNYIFLLGYGCVFGMCGIAKRFIPLFLGSGFEPVVNLLYLMSPLVIIIGVSNCLGSQYYTPSGKRKLSAKYIVIGSVLNLCLNLIFIPKFGAFGAVIASILAELCITFLYMNSCDHYLSYLTLFTLSWKRILAGMIMFICVYGFGIISEIPLLLTVLLQLLIGVTVYYFVLIIMKDDMLMELSTVLLKSIRKRLN